MRATWTVFVLFLAPLCFFQASAQAPQSPEQLEARIAKLPPDERVYERFRYWVTQQPAGVQSGADRLEKYKAYLKTPGFEDTDIEAQIALVAARGRNLETERWNRILTAEKPAFNTNPNAFLVEMARAHKPGTALDVGMGQGRNAIWLAQNGWTVTGFDPADKAVALANQTAERLGVHLNTEITTTEKFDFGESRWDLILLSYVGARGITEKIERGLKPDGILVIEGAHRDATKGASIGAGVVFGTGELIQLFPDLRVVRYEEPVAPSDFGQVKTRVVRYCGQKVE